MVPDFNSCVEDASVAFRPDGVAVGCEFSFVSRLDQHVVADMDIAVVGAVYAEMRTRGDQTRIVANYD